MTLMTLSLVSMEVIDTLLEELISFLNLTKVIEMVKTGDYSSLATVKGILSLAQPIIPLLLIIEIIKAFLTNKLRTNHYKVFYLVYIFNRIVSGFISISAIAFCIGLFQKYSILETSFTWYWMLYGYVIWEFAHFVYHYLAHKVRIFWCLHSTHHALENMNLSVGYVHFLLEGPYAEIIRTTICIVMGVSPEMLVIIMIIDGTWGAFIHVGDDLIKGGSLGFLDKIILTPVHHRLHHARNPVYMDTNFCNLLNIWDKIFGTYMDVRRDIPIEYGITRPINANNFFDVYFGESVALAKDIWHARGFKNKLLYIIMPPGWSHAGLHKTAKIVRREFLQMESGNTSMNHANEH